MKNILRFILIGIIITGAILLTAENYFAADQSASITASGTKPLTPGALLDDFRYGAPLNIWGAAAGTFASLAASPDVYCTASYTNNTGIRYGTSDYSLQLDYKVNTAGGFSGYYSKLASQPLAGYTAVSFYVKGAAGGEFFKIQLSNTGTTSYWDTGAATHYYRNMASIYVTDYLDGGVTTSWQKVTIPLHNFMNLDDWNSMSELAFVFENAQGTANGSATQGTVYIDNITFETGAINTVRIDHFGNKIGICALGGNMGTAAGSGSTITYGFSNAANEYYLYPYGLSLTYNVNSGTWASLYLIFGGGNTDNTVEHPEKSGWIAIPHDFSAYNNLQIAMKAKSDTENPSAIKLEVVDDTGAKSVILRDISTNWLVWKVPLASAFSGLHKNSIKQINFVVDAGAVGNAGGKAAGTVFIDSVQFEQ